jgi:hypothetical protein
LLCFLHFRIPQGKETVLAMSGKRPLDSSARAVEIIMAVLGLAAGIWLVLH